MQSDCSLKKVQIWISALPDPDTKYREYELRLVNEVECAWNDDARNFAFACFKLSQFCHWRQIHRANMDRIRWGRKPNQDVDTMVAEARL